MTIRSNQHLYEQEELYQMIREFKAQESDAVKEKLVLHFENLIHSLARRFSRGQELYEDLVQVGMIGLLAALSRYDESYGKSFESFAIPTIVGEMKRYIRDKTWSIHVPRRIKELGPKIKHAIEELTNQYQRSPQVHEIASYLDVSEEEVLETMEMNRSYQALSVDSTLDSDAEGSSVTLLDLVGEQEEGYDLVNRRLVLEKILNVLDPREKKVIQLTFYQEMSQKEAGEALQISQMHVSRLQRRALQKMKEMLNQETSELIK